MSDELEIKLDRPNRKSTASGDYLELTENKSPAAVDSEHDHGGRLLWPCFIRDHTSYLPREYPCEYQIQGDLVLAHNAEGFRVFDSTLDRLTPILTMDEDLLSWFHGETHAKLSEDGKYVLCLAGREQNPEDWNVKVYRIEGASGDFDMPVCSFTAADISEDIPASATAEVDWITVDSFVIYAKDEGSNYGSKWIYQLSTEEPCVECVVKCPMPQVCDETADFLYQRVTPDKYFHDERGNFGAKSIVALSTKPSTFEVYAIQEKFRHLGTLCPFGNERNMRESWSSTAESFRYVYFYYLDDNESNREVRVYDFGPDPEHLVMEEAFRAPMFPGESYDDVKAHFFETASTTLLCLMCMAEGKEEMLVYDVGKREERKSNAGLHRKTSMASMENDVSHLLVGHFRNTSSRGQEYGCFGPIPDHLTDASLLATMFQQLPKKYFIVFLHEHTKLAVFDIENNWNVVVADFQPFDVGRLEIDYSGEIGSILATRPGSNIPAALLVLPEKSNSVEFREQLVVIDLKQNGKILREEKMSFHEAFLTPLHTYVMVRNGYSFTILDVLTSKRKTILDWDQENSEISTGKIKGRVSPDDRFLAIAARHQIRVFELGMNQSCEPVAILDYKEKCKKLCFRSCLPSRQDNNDDGRYFDPTDVGAPTLASYWDHLYYEDKGKVFARYEKDTNQFVQLQKIDEAKQQLMFLSRTLMLAICPYDPYNDNTTEEETIAVLRVDLNLQGVLDLSIPDCNVKKIGSSQRILVCNPKTLRLFDFGISDHLVDSLALLPNETILEEDSTTTSDSIDCSAFVTVDATPSRKQAFSIVKFLRTGPEMMQMPGDGVSLSPFDGRKFTAHFLTGNNGKFVLFISFAHEISLFELSSNTLTPVASVQRYMLPSIYTASHSMWDNTWLELNCAKGFQMINLEAAADEKYNPRDHYFAINHAESFRSITGNTVLLKRDKSASLSIYELQDENPVEVFALNRICDIENKFGAPEIDTDTTSDGRFLIVKNMHSFSADASFVLVFDLRTKSKTPILRKNFGSSNTNFQAFVPRGSCTHFVICIPKKVEVYDLYALAKDAGKNEPSPILQITVEQHDFLKCTESFSADTDNLPDPSPPPKVEDEEEKKEGEEVDPNAMTDEQKSSKSIIVVTKKNDQSVSFYFLPSTGTPQLLRTIVQPFGMLATEVRDDWPYVILHPVKDNACKIVKMSMKSGKLEMTDKYDYTPMLTDVSEIKNRMLNYDDKMPYIYISTSNHLSVHRLGERGTSKEILSFPGDTRKTTFEFTRGDDRGLLYITGTSTVLLIQLSTGVKHNVLPHSQRHHKIIRVGYDGDYMLVTTTSAILMFTYEREGDVRSATELVGEIDIDPTWPVSSWSFQLRLDRKIGVVTRTDYSSCLCIYRNIKLLEPDTAEASMKWPLVDVLVDQKTDPEWSNAKFQYASDFQYMYCYSSQRVGVTVFDLSRLAVEWYPVITWSTVENILKFDLARSADNFPNVDRFLRLYKEILVGPMSPKDPLSAIDHLCTTNHVVIQDGRHRALALFLLHMAKGALQLTTSPVPRGENYPRPRRTVLGALIAKKDWLSCSVLLDFLAAAHRRGGYVPLADNCVEFGYELVELAEQHSPTQVARFLKDFALQKLSSTSPVSIDAIKMLRGVKFGKNKFLTCGSDIREPIKLWSLKYKKSEGGDRYDVCFVAIPGLSSDKSREYPIPVFHKLVQVAQSTECAELIANPALEAVIDFKWRAFARSRFLMTFGIHLFATVCVILFCSFLPLQDKTADLSTVALTHEGGLCIAMLTIFSFYAVYTLIKEVHELLVQGIVQYLGVWNFAALLQSALLLTTAVLYLERSERAKFVAGASVLICHIYILFYLQALETTGPLIRMILRISSDMKYFTGVLFLCLVACTFFYIAVTEGTGIGEGNVFQVFLRMYETFFFFNFDADSIDGLETSEQITVAYLVIVGGSMFVAIVLLNLLIALMGDSFAAIKSRDTLELQLLRAGMVRDIEFTMTIKTPTLVKERFPRWIHCLLPIKETQARENNETLEEIHKLRAEVAKLEERLLAGSGGRRGSVDHEQATVLRPKKRGSIASLRGSVASKRGSVVSKRASVTSQRGSKTLDELLAELS